MTKLFWRGLPGRVTALAVVQLLLLTTFAVAVGTGSFGAHPTTPSFGASNSNSSDVALADIDGDGDVDAVVANITSQAETVWLNDGSGAFSAHPTTPSFGAGDSTDVALADLDSDGDVDAVVANDNGQTETVWRNNGSGAFSAHPTTPSFGAGDSGGLALGDLDGDGDVDAVVANEVVQAETVWLNDGTGAFSAHPTTPSFGAGDSLGLALADLDADGDLDAVIANSSLGAETVWRNDGSGNFTAHPTTPAFGAGTSAAVALGDIDLDGDVDAVVANATTEAETVWLNDGTGAFSAHPTTPSFSANTFTFGIALGNLDGDADLDAITANFVAQPERVWVNNGFGALSPHPTTPSFGAGDGTAVELADLDLDGDTDAVIANANGPETVWLNANSTAPYTVSIGDVTQAEGNAPAKSLRFTVTLNKPPVVGAGVSFDYTTTPGTAEGGGVDYVDTAGTVTFLPGEVQRTIVVPLVTDTVIEPDETFFVNVQSITNAVAEDGQGKGTILDDDSFVTPELLIVKTDLLVPSVVAGGTITYQISAANGPSSPVPAVVTVTDTFGPRFTSVAWTCQGFGASCPTPAGTGDINEVVTLPIDSSVTYFATAQVSPAALGSVTNAASVSTALGATPNVVYATSGRRTLVTAPQSLPAVVTTSTNWALNTALDGSPSDITFTNWGTRPLVPLTGDWDGDGVKTPGYFKNGVFTLANVVSAPIGPPFNITFGDARGFPLSGDFDGDGKDDLAVFRAGLWQIRYTDDAATTSFSYGAGTWPATVPVAGDWDGDGIDGIGVYALSAGADPAGTWRLRNSASAGLADVGPFVFNPGTTPYGVVGDWNADGVDSVGVKAGTTWCLKNANVTGPACDVTFGYGLANDLPVIWRNV